MDPWAKQLEKVKNHCKEKNLFPVIERAMGCTERAEGIFVRLMSWNVLAQGLSGLAKYVNCPPEVLEKDQRFPKIVYEILRLRPTIVCLQEVDMFDYLSSELGAAGYKGHFSPKPKSPCLKYEGNIGPDGLAMFYRTSEVEMLESTNIKLGDEPDSKNQQAMVARFQFKYNKDLSFVAATTHLNAKPWHEDLRHKQGERLEQFLKEKYPSEAILVCGDFNADPKEKVYSLFKESLLDVGSVYTYQTEKGEEPPYTFWTKTEAAGELCKAVDFIWYTKKSLWPIAILTIPNEETIGKDLLPSKIYPSDHLSITGDFLFN